MRQTVFLYKAVDSVGLISLVCRGNVLLFSFSQPAHRSLSWGRVMGCLQREKDHTRLHFQPQTERNCWGWYANVLNKKTQWQPEVLRRKASARRKWPNNSVCSRLLRSGTFSFRRSCSTTCFSYSAPLCALQTLNVCCRLPSFRQDVTTAACCK